MSGKRVFTVHRLTIASLSLLAVAGCSTVIGLGDYKVGSDTSDAGNSESGSGNAGSANANAGASGSTVEVKPDGGEVKPDAGGKPEGGASSAGTGGEAGEPSGGSGGVSAGGSAGTGVGGTGVGGTGAGGSSAGAAGRAGAAGSAGAGGGSAGAGGACPTGCDDSNPCTIDLCDSTGCVHTPVDALCSGTCMKCSVTLGCQDLSTTQELLTDGNFDTGTGTGWAQTSTNENTNVADSLVLIKTPPAGITAQSAPNIVALGVKNNEQTFITQQLNIPANTAALILTGSVWVKSADTVAGSDQAWIDLTTDPNDPTTYLDVFSKVWFNENAGTAWMAISENADLSNLPPAQSVWLTVLGLNDVSDISNFYFDSLSVKAKVCTQ